MYDPKDTLTEYGNIEYNATLFNLEKALEYIISLSDDINWPSDFFADVINLSASLDELKNIKEFEIITGD